MYIIVKDVTKCYIHIAYGKIKLNWLIHTGLRSRVVFTQDGLLKQTREEIR